MTTTTLSSARAFAGLQIQPPDPLLSLIRLYNEDPRASKIDLGVGVYRDEAGGTPIMRAVKAAEQVLLDTQPTKAYLGPEGDLAYLDAIRPIIFGAGGGTDFFAMQTPGGTGALRLAAALAAAGRADAKVWLGTPSWPIHAQIFAAAGLATRTFAAFDVATQATAIDSLMSALGQAEAGDLVLLHGCCHNPTGADLTLDQWRAVTSLIAQRGIVPIVDLAYQGLGDGLDEDAAGLRHLIAHVETAIVAYSFDKNFALYRERTGAIFVRAPGQQPTVNSNLLQIARGAWSMPPDHGAAVVRLILQDAALAADWRAELDEMRGRLNGLRTALADAHPRLRPLRDQRGLFALLPFSPAQVESIRRDHAVYMAGSGRINVAGLNTETLPRFVAAFDTVLSA